MKAELITIYDPKSPVSEMFRALRTNLQYFNEQKKGGFSILVTSTMQEHGKSFVTANIAVTFAKIDKKVLLIDTDIRKPRLHKIFEMDNDRGLSDYLANRTENLLVRKTKVTNLSIVTAGSIVANPSELLDSEKFKDLLAELKNYYDYIIVDSSPAVIVTDPIIVSGLVDTTVLVGIYGKTRVDDIKSVIRKINHVGGKIAGVVMNKVNVSMKKYDNKYFYGVDLAESKSSIRLKIKRFFYKLKEKNRIRREEKSNIENETISNEIVVETITPKVEEIKKEEAQKKVATKKETKIKEPKTAATKVTGKTTKIIKSTKVAKTTSKTEKKEKEPKKSTVKKDTKKVKDILVSIDNF